MTRAAQLKALRAELRETKTAANDLWKVGEVQMAESLRAKSARLNAAIAELLMAKWTK